VLAILLSKIHNNRDDMITRTIPITGYKMKNKQSISASLSSMSAGSALTVTALCFATDSPHPTTLFGLIGLSVFLVAISSIVAAAETRKQIENVDNDIEFLRDDHNYWVRQHDHDRELKDISNAHEKTNNVAEFSARTESLSDRINECDSKIDNLAANIEKILVANVESR